MSHGWRRVHLVGIGGTGQSGLARLLAGEGVRVSGSDAVRSVNWETLAGAGIDAWIGSRPERISKELDLLVRSVTVPDSDAEISAARAAGVPVLKYAEAVGRAVAGRRLATVSGTHGKTTTCGMTVEALLAGGRSPGFLIGGERIEEPSGGARASRAPEFVLEACEYDRSFLQYAPEAAGVTCVDPDHLDYFGSPEAFREAFESFLDRVRPGGTIVLAGDAVGLRTPTGRKVVRTGKEEGCDWRLLSREVSPEGSRVVVAAPGGTIGPVSVRLPGAHNVANVLVAAALAHALGVPAAQALEGAARFGGMRRRFEVRSWRGGHWVDDYAHHPAELAALLDAARQRFPGRPVWLLFQPHQFVRTRVFLDRFAEVLARADKVVLAPIYGVREAGDRTVDHGTLGGRALAQGADVVCARDLDEVALRVVEAPPGAVVLCAGAGDIWTVARRVGSPGAG